jgi:hypothetical protein
MERIMRARIRYFTASERRLRHHGMFDIVLRVAMPTNVRGLADNIELSAKPPSSISRII